MCLYVMTERSNFARIFRDTFDQLMNATVGNLIERCGPDSAELIYMSSQHRKGDGESLPYPAAGNPIINEKEMIQQKDGMPPAIERTFGRGQAEEHVGFVENSQVDLKEQEKFKKKQGMLEKTSVPRSLSHLLQAATQNEHQHSRNQHQHRHSHKKIKLENRTSPDANQYIVKKPINGIEFEWQNFQKQAFLQQQLAQQNLQAYLSSLNYNMSQENNEPMPNQVPRQQPQPQQQPLNIPQRNNNTNVNSMRELNMILESTRTAGPTPPLSHIGGVNDITGNVNLDRDGNMGENGKGVLFSNGTHNMINNISTWTNDSVIDLINGNRSSTLPFFTEPPVTSQQAVPNPKGDEGSATGNNNNPLRDSINSLAATSSVITEPIMSSGHVEDFWTVNDDYGFLT